MVLLDDEIVLFWRATRFNCSKTPQLHLKMGFGDFQKEPYLVTLFKPEIGATRCTFHENRQKLSILLLFWRFFEIFGKSIIW